VKFRALAHATEKANAYLPTQELSADERQEVHALLTLAAEHVRQAAGDNLIQVSEDMVGGRSWSRLWPTPSAVPPPARSLLPR
jgi:hypothetical protein